MEAPVTLLLMAQNKVVVWIVFALLVSVGTSVKMKVYRNLRVKLGSFINRIQ